MYAAVGAGKHFCLDVGQHLRDGGGQIAAGSSTDEHATLDHGRSGIETIQCQRSWQTEVLGQQLAQRGIHKINITIAHDEVLSIGKTQQVKQPRLCREKRHKSEDSGGIWPQVCGD